MIETAFIIAMVVFFIHVTTWEGHVNEKRADWLEEKIGEYWSKPIFGCPICMSPWWGGLILWVSWLLSLHNFHFFQCVLIVFAAGGINVFSVILSKFYEVLKLVEENEEQQVYRS